MNTDTHASEHHHLQHLHAHTCYNYCTEHNCASRNCKTSKESDKVLTKRTHVCTQYCIFALAGRCNEPVTMRTHAHTDTEQSLRSTCADWLAVTYSDSVPYASYQHLAKSLWWCVRNYTSVKGVSPNPASLTLTLPPFRLNISQCLEFDPTVVFLHIPPTQRSCRNPTRSL